ncbi:hypothetical protein ABZV58_05255 [Nocardia sp. NPDC004654]|uniref:hypothetical protein n=1 Tax=Nocardia sp. NPDC004654 TaxID=3154776 RepID=UPI0033A91EA1
MKEAVSATMQPSGHSGHRIYNTIYGVDYWRELEWDANSDTTAIEREREAARAAVTALVQFSQDFVLFQEFGLTKRVMHRPDDVWLKAESELPEWHWYLKRQDAATDPVYNGAIITEVETIDTAAMLELVDTLAAAPCELAADQWPAWEEMYVWNTSVRVPDNLIPEQVDYLIVDDDDNKVRDLRIPLVRRQDTAWVSRPDLGFWTPLTLHVDRDFGYSDTHFHYDQLRLSVSVHWSLWWEEDAPGRTMLDAAFDHIEAEGWQLQTD